MKELLEVRELKTYFILDERRIVKAVDNVSIRLSQGESLGLAGESGCGKSTLGYSILTCIPRPGKIVGGEILFEGENVANKPESWLRRHYRWIKVSMVFQGAMNSLNPVLTVGRQLSEPLVYHKNMTYKEARKYVVEALKLVGLPEHIADRYPHELSGGMKQRAVIAMALILKPKLVIADEPTTALDVVVQAQIINLLKNLTQREGMGLILITHDLSVLSEVVDKVAIMYAGKIVEYGTSEQIYLTPKHPYTQKLLRAVPRLHVKVDKLEFIPGAPPNLISPPPGCRFHPRCPIFKEKSNFKGLCDIEEPPLIEVEPEHKVACWIYAKR